MAILVVFGFVYMQDKNSLFFEFFDFLAPVNWDEIDYKAIVKNSIPITLIESNGNNCILEAMRLNDILDHRYFIQSEQLADELNYDREQNTIKVPCEKLHGDKSQLEIWYVTEESKKDSTKYQYWINEWNSTKIKNNP